MILHTTSIPLVNNADSDSMISLLHFQMTRFPEKIAIITPEKTITYRYLLEQAAILAHALREKGITHEMPVAILQPPSIEQVISQIGILMAGGSCVPLDPDMPDARLNDMLDDLQVHWTLSLTPQPGRGLHTNLLLFSDYANGNKSYIEDVRITPYHRTHVLFTSGTTGKPKAVEIETRNILRLVVDTHYVVFDINDRTACIANPTFDASLFEIWGTLLNGATLIIIPKAIVLNIHQFQTQLIQQKITLMVITKTLFDLIATTYPQTFRYFRYLLVGGEALNPHTLKQVLDSGPPEHLLNAYGPTESTTIALTHEIDAQDVTGGSVPIGRPIDRTSAFVLDEHLQPTATGEIGHLYLGGEGLARGYWNREALNRERFVNVFLHDMQKSVRLYKTGDLALQRTDGVFLFAGRVDNQIKIRGHRIELEEIEAHLLRTGHVLATTACLVKPEDKDAFLAAFIVIDKPEEVKREDILAILRTYLPDYMLPELVTVAEIPLTPTGKTDRNRLLAQLETADSDTPDACSDALSDTELALQRLWRTLLNHRNINLDDNFFNLGGNSLQAAQLIISLQRQFDISFSIQTLYDAPTLRMLANVVSQKAPCQNGNLVEQWLQDSLLPDDIVPSATPPSDWSQNPHAVALLSGVTGFFAAFLLRDLLVTGAVRKVICLVRATDDAQALQRVLSNLKQYGIWHPSFNARIEAVASDFALPQLGLATLRYQQLAGECDVIFHLGAHVNYIQPYQAHRASNIEGTLNILRFAICVKTKPLHYASTIAAFGPVGLLNNTTCIYENDNLSSFLEGMKYDSGYSQSQWVVEQLVWQAQQRGVALAVYRPGFIVGDSVNGISNPKDFVARLIRGCIMLGAYPELPRQRKEFITVDYASAALLTIAQDKRNLGQAYHLVPPDPASSIDLEMFFTLLGECGYPLQKKAYADWISNLQHDPMLEENPLMPLLPMLSEKVYQQLTRWQVYENMPAYDSSHTQSALSAAKSQLKFSPMNKQLLMRYIHVWQQQGFLPAQAARSHD